jgi:hypothetical protein
MSSERDSPMYFQTKPDTIWIPIGLTIKVWFGNTSGFPSHTTSGFLLADKNKVWFGNLLGGPSHLTMLHAPFALLIGSIIGLNNVSIIN